MFDFVGGAFRSYLTTWIGQRAMHDLRERLFDRLQRLSVSFFDRNAIGRLMTRVTSDVEVLNDLFSSGVVAIIGDLVLMVAILVMMFAMSWQLALVTLLLLPGIAAISFFFRRRMRDAHREIRQWVARLNAFLQEHVTGLSVVQLFRREEDSKREFRQISREQLRAQIRSVYLYSLFYPLVEVGGAIAIALILWYGGGRILQDAMTFGTLVAFLQYSTSSTRRFATSRRSTTFCSRRWRPGSGSSPFSTSPSTWIPAVRPSFPSRAGRRAPYPTAGPPAEQCGGGRERGPVEAGNGPQQRRLHLGIDRRVELAQPRLLLVATGPLLDRRPQVVQLHAAVVGAAPHVQQPLAQLGVPHQRRHVVEDDRHPHVVDGRVGEHPDSLIGSRAAAEQPQVPGAGQIDCPVEAQLGPGHGRSLVDEGVEGARARRAGRRRRDRCRHRPGPAPALAADTGAGARAAAPAARGDGAG